MSFYDKVNELCRNKNRTIWSVAQDLGISKGTVSNWKGLSRPPRQATIKAIADYFDVPLSYFDDNSTPPIAANVYPVDGITYFDEVGTIKAGFGGTVDEVPTGERVPIPIEFLHRQPKEEYFVLRVRGNSMYPRIMDGDQILCRRCETVEDGAIAVVLFNGDEATLKKVHYEFGKPWVELIPLNPEYAPIRLQGQDLDRMKILGRVTKSLRDF
jgi:repressor LexA